MNSSNPLIETPKSSAPVRLLSHWIEYIAVPICSAIMETQPVVLLLLMLGGRIFGEGMILPDALSITLIILSLHWWMMWLRYKADQRETTQKSQDARLPAPNTALCFLGIFLVMVVYSLLHIQELSNSQFVTASLLLISGSALRAIYQSRENLNDQLLSTMFRICFFIMLIVLFFGFMASLSGNTDLINAFASSFPLFFISGVIGLSFTRLGTIQREREKQPGSAGKESIKSWVTGLTVTWIGVVLVSILLESVPLQIISPLFNWVWSVLGIIGNAILYVIIVVMDAITYAVFVVIFFIYSLFPRQQLSTTALKPRKFSTGGSSVLLNGQIPFFVLFIAIIIGIIFLLRRRRNKKSIIISDEEEEVREQLNRADVRKERDKEGKNRRQQARDLEMLDPTSMRARYREFLQAMTRQGGDMQRKMNETPLEYQHRVLELARTQHLLQDDDEQASSVFLSELTLAYTQERYGGEQIDPQRKEALHTYLPQFMQRLTPKETQPKSSGWSAEKARWGED